ncbi:MAG: amidohydrolase family protein, partial [Thermoanaerobaculia bacterium]
MSTGKALMGLACLAAVTVPSFSEDTADLVLRNGAFYAVSEPGRVVGSLAVRNGRIVFLGPDAELRPYLGPETEILDLAGRTVTPGWIDAHSHLLSLGAALSQVDLVGTSSYDEVVERVRAAAREVSTGEWVLGRGWDQNDWPEKSFPVHGPLSRAVPDHLVWMARIDGHAALLNEQAMRLLGIDGSVSDP